MICQLLGLVNSVAAFFDLATAYIYRIAIYHLKGDNFPFLEILFKFLNTTNCFWHKDKQKKTKFI